MSATDEPRYVHGTSDREQGRLSRLNALLNERALVELDLRPGQRVLDVGCGTGELTVAIARKVGEEGRVVGIDREERSLAAARSLVAAAGLASRVELRAGDATALPCTEQERGSFDVAHARFLLEHLPDPRAALRPMLRALRPGGRLVLCDDDHEDLNLWPPAPAFEACWRAHADLYARLGNDARVGRRLPELLHEVGAIPVRATVLPFAGCFGQRGWPDLVACLGEVVQGARDAVVASGLLSGSSFRDAEEELRTWSQRPGASIWYGLRWAEGRRPGFGPGEVARRSGLP